MASVDLPLPVPPIIPSVSPLFIVNEILSIESSPAFSYANETFLNSIIGLSLAAVSTFSPLLSTSGSTSKTSLILFAEAKAFVNVTIRFARTMSASSICVM